MHPPDSVSAWQAAYCELQTAIMQGSQPISWFGELFVHVTLHAPGIAPPLELPELEPLLEPLLDPELLPLLDPRPDPELPPLVPLELPLALASPHDETEPAVHFPGVPPDVIEVHDDWSAEGGNTRLVPAQ
jgi:hypothetical protein